MTRIFLGFHRGVRGLRFGQENLDALCELGEVVLNESDRPLTSAELIAASKDCPIIVSDRLTPGDASFFESASDLVAYVRTVTDIKAVDVAAASRQGILVTAAGATFVPGVTEWIVAQMINLSRHMFDYVAIYRSGTTPSLATGPQGRQLAGKTAGIIGLGRLGRRLAEILVALGMKVIGYDPHASDWPAAVEQADLPRLLGSSDFVILLAKHTPQTTLMMNHSIFGQVKRGAFFINAARGELVDEAALEHALIHGPIAGAALDVGSGEGDVPPVHIARLPNVLATPHVAPSADANYAQGRQAVGMVADILQGRIPEGALNADMATRMKKFR